MSDSPGLGLSRQQSDDPVIFGKSKGSGKIHFLLKWNMTIGHLNDKS
jgi:hypothetical protein